MFYNDDEDDDDNEPVVPSTYSKLDDKINYALLESRRLFLSQAIDNESANAIIKKLWYLELKAPGKPILLVINSPGGSVDSGFAIWDQIKMITSPVTTLVTGLAASMGSVLSLCSAPKRRFATPNARFMIHQPMIGGVIKGQATDLEIQAKEILKTRQALVALYVEATGRSAESIERAIDRDTWMTAEEAKTFGLLDGIVTSYKELA
jgi:ATP-dependent Clp protease, protease subunit